MVILPQHRAIVALVVHHGLGIPLATAFDIRQRTLQGHLALHLVPAGIHGVGLGHRAVHVLPDDEGAMPGMLAPPSYQGVIISRRMPYFPIDLRDVVVHPSFIHPLQHIGIQVVIVLQAVRVAAVFRVTFQVAIDAKRRHAKLHPRFDGMDALVHLADKLVHVLPPPVVAIHSPSVARIGLVIRDAQSAFGIRIEVIIDVDAVHIITQQDVCHHVADIVPVLGDARVHNQLPAVLEIAVGMLEIRMRLCHFLCSFRLGPVGIDPGMQFHAPCVALHHHPLQRIPIGRRRSPLPPRQETAPRFEAAGIKRIELRTHLEEDGVDATLLQLVQLVSQRALHLFCPHARELVVHTLYPCAPELPLGRQLGLQRKDAKPQHQKQK